MLSNGVKISVLSSPHATGQYTQNGTPLDMEGFEGVLFLVLITASLNTGTFTLQANGNTISSTSGMTLFNEGTSAATAGSDGALNDNVLALDIYKPLERYIIPQVVTAVANGAIGEIIAIQYGPRTKPTVQPAAVQDLTQLISP